MRKNLFPWTAAIGLAVSLSFSSCTYDPYYSSVGGSYSSGYGYGYGYGGSSFSTSLFVNTGDSRWGYDPYTYCYYDYRTRRYYDPYLYGYYPVGYRPPVLIGVPHPYGWRPGRGYCPPPRTIRNVTVVNYRNREAAYHGINHSWARNVRQQNYSHSRSDGYRGQSGSGNFPGSHGRSHYFNPRGPSSGRDHYIGPQSGQNQTWNRGDHNRSFTESWDSFGNHSRNRANRDAVTPPIQGRLPYGYNTPVTDPPSIQPDAATRHSRGGGPRFEGRQIQPHQPLAPNEAPSRFGRSQYRERQDQQPSFRGRGPTPQPNIQPQPVQPQADGAPNPGHREGRRGGLRSLGEG